MEWCCTPDSVDAFTDGTLEEHFGEVAWLGSNTGAAQSFCRREYGEFFGNEASSCEFYTKARAPCNIERSILICVCSECACLMHYAHSCKYCMGFTLKAWVGSPRHGVGYWHHQQAAFLAEIPNIDERTNDNGELLSKASATITSEQINPIVPPKGKEVSDEPCTLSHFY